MSLIYAALNTLEQRQAGVQTPSAPLPAAMPPARRLWPLAAGGIAVMLGGAAVVWLLQQTPPLPAATPNATVALQQALPVAAAAPQPVAVDLPVTNANFDSADSAPAAIVADRAMPDAGRTPLPAPAPAAAEPPAPAVPVAALTQPAQQTDLPAGLVLRHPVGESRPAAADSTGQLAAGARRAIDAGRDGEAQALMLQLETRLAPESITLLRLRAWQALQADDAHAALSLYRQITARLPDDESASLNLALAHWKLGQQEEARRIARQLVERRPESELARRYLAQFGGGQ